EEVEYRQCRCVWPALSVLLKGSQFRKLSVTTFNLSENAVKHLRTIIRANEIANVSLDVHEVSCSDPESFLLYLSAITHSLEIYQKHIFGKFLDCNSKYFFGVHNIDWAPIILHMFSQKLDKLKKFSYPKFLSVASADHIRQKLPDSGKKIWFYASCKSYAKDLDYKDCEYLVHAIPSTRYGSFLQIKHQSRKYEP
ncbi:hypothetical protein PENTCL1PPCAC_18880, partial [Pristionchus entomophagus]